LLDEEFVTVDGARVKRVFTVINASSFVIAAQILGQRRDPLKLES
jgi:hypothetical protein